MCIVVKELSSTQSGGKGGGWRGIQSISIGYNSRVFNFTFVHGDQFPDDSHEEPQTTI